MPSGKIKPPAFYPEHWHRCLEWLASRASGEIELTLPAVRASLHTQHRKAIAMRASIREYPGWSWAVKVMVQNGELHFEKRGAMLWAVRRKEPRSVEEVIRSTTKVLADRH